MKERWAPLTKHCSPVCYCQLCLGLHCPGRGAATPKDSTRVRHVRFVTPLNDSAIALCGSVLIGSERIKTDHNKSKF